MSDDRQVREALQKVVGEPIRYFELVQLSIDNGSLSRLTTKAWAWILLARQKAFFRDFAERGKTWYSGPVPEMTDNCFGQPMNVMRDVSYPEIVKVVKDANTRQHFKLELRSKKPDGRPQAIFIKSTNRASLIRYIKLCWQINVMYGYIDKDGKRVEGRVQLLEEIQGKLTLEDKIKRAPEIRALWAHRWEAFMGYKFMIPDMFGSAPQVVQAGHAIRFTLSDACSDNDASVTIFVHPQLTFERLKMVKPKRDHIRWVAAGYKHHLIKDADVFHINRYQSRQKRMNLSGDCASWHMWEIQLITKHANYVCVVCRRQYLPPLCNTAQDIGIIVRCPAAIAEYRNLIVDKAHLIADSLCPDTDGYHIYTDIVQAKLDALRYDEGGMEWIESQVNEAPTHKLPGEDLECGCWVKTTQPVKIYQTELEKANWIRPNDIRKAINDYCDKVFPEDQRESMKANHLPKNVYGRVTRYNKDMKTWRIAWYLPQMGKTIRRYELRVRKRRLSSLQVLVKDSQDREIGEASIPKDVKEMADKPEQKDLDERELQRAKAATEQAAPPKMKPSVEAGAKAFVRRILELFTSSPKVIELLKEAPRKEMHEGGDADDDQNFTAEASLEEMRKQLSDQSLRMAKRTDYHKEGNGNDSMNTFLKTFTVGKDLLEKLEVEVGLNNFSMDQGCRWQISETEGPNDDEKCIVCNRNNAERRSSYSSASGASDELSWCLGSVVNTSKGHYHGSTRHCFKYCLSCWQVRNEWTKRVANYFAWAVDGGLLGSRFPIPNQDRYGTLLDVILEVEMLKHLDEEKKRELFIALYFMLHMRQIDYKRSYDSELHVIDMQHPDDDCNGLYKFCGVSGHTFGFPWFQKTTKKDVVMYLFDMNKSENPPWKGQLEWWKKHGRDNEKDKDCDQYWVIVKGRREHPEPNQDEELVAFKSWRPSQEQKEYDEKQFALAWPPHGRGKDQESKWIWNRMTVPEEAVAKKRGVMKNASGVYRLRVSKVQERTDRRDVAGTGEDTYKETWEHIDRHGIALTVKLQAKEKKGHHPAGAADRSREMLTLHLEGAAEDDVAKKVVISKNQKQPRVSIVFSYSDGDFTLLYHQVQYVNLRKWEFNDRVMMMLLSKRYFSKELFPAKQSVKGHAEAPEHAAAADPASEVQHSDDKSDEADQDRDWTEEEIKQSMADRIKCLAQLLDSNASWDLQAFVCRALMDINQETQSLSGGIDESTYTLALESLVKLVQTDNLFITTYATAALVNLSKDRSHVKGMLLGLGISKLCMKNLATRDEGLTHYTLMLIAGLTKDPGHRAVVTDCGLSPAIYDLLLSSYSAFMPSSSSASKVIVKGFDQDAFNSKSGRPALQVNGSFSRYIINDPENYNCFEKAYKSDNADGKYCIFVYPKEPQFFFVLTQDPGETQYNDTTTVVAYSLATPEEKKKFLNGELPLTSTETRTWHMNYSLLGPSESGAKKSKDSTDTTFKEKEEIKLSRRKTDSLTLGFGKHGKASKDKEKGAAKLQKGPPTEITLERKNDSWPRSKDSKEKHFILQKDDASGDQGGVGLHFAEDPPDVDTWHIIGLPGEQWWCIAEDFPSKDTCKDQVDDDYLKKNGLEAGRPTDAYKPPEELQCFAWAWNLIDAGDGIDCPPTDNWDARNGFIDPDTNKKELIPLGAPRVSAIILPSKERILVQLCIVIGQLANDEHYRRHFLYEGAGDSVDFGDMPSRHTMPCLLYMFDQVVGVGEELLENLTDKRQSSLSMVIFAIKQLCTNDSFQKKEVGKLVIKPIVQVWHGLEASSLNKQFVFQSFNLMKTLAVIWENMLIIIDVKPPSGEWHAEQEGQTEFLVLSALNKLRQCNFANTPEGQGGWEQTLSAMVADIKAVAQRLGPRGGT